MVFIYIISDQLRFFAHLHIELSYLYIYICLYIKVIFTVLSFDTKIYEFVCKIIQRVSKFLT